MLAKFSVKKPLTVLVAVVMIIVFGFVSFTSMTPDLFPKIDLPYVMVMTSYPGASSEEIEKSVSAPLEQQLASIGNLKNINSQSQKNVSMVFLEFNEDANLDVISVDIRDKIDMVKGSFVDEISSPIIFKMNPEMMPVTVAAISKEGSDIFETSTLVEEELQRKLEGTDGVASVSTSGLVDNTIHVRINDKKINKINNKIGNMAGGQLNKGKAQIASGMSQMDQGASNVNAGKIQITSAQKQLAAQSEKIKGALSSLLELYKQKEVIDRTNFQIKSKITAENPGLSNSQIESLCMKNDAYANGVRANVEIQRAISGIKSGLEPMKNQLGTMGINVAKLNSSREVMTAQSNFNVFIATTNANLGNSMAELTGSQALLQASKMQLQGQLASMNQSMAAAPSGNISGALTVDGISSIINSQNFEMPAGLVSEDGKDVLVTVGNKITNIKGVSDLVIMDTGISGMNPIKLKDVADISYLNNGEETYSKVNGEDGVLLSFSKQSDFATAKVSENIQKKFTSLEKEYDGVKFNVLSDQGEYIKLAIGSVLKNLLLGGLLSILILLFFLRDLKPTFITACSIPISVTFAIALMYFSGVTINMISLAGLAVGVGMLVDNSIVVIENIYRLRMLGYSKVKAAISGAVQVSGAITASTLTTICVFIPIVFIDGVTRTIFQDMALTVSFSLLASLFIALTLVPALGSTILNKTKDNTVLSEKSKIIIKYKKLVQGAMNHKIIILGLAVFLLISSIGICIAKGFEFMPSMATKEISASVTLPKGSELADTKKACDKILDEIGTGKEIDTAGVMLNSGMAGMMGMSSGGSENDSANIYVLLNEEYISSGKSISDKILKAGEAEGCEVKITSDMNMMAATGGTGISLNVYGDDLDNLRETTLNIEKELGTIDGLSDISKTEETTAKEIRVNIDKNKAMKYGLTTAQVYMQISEKISKEKTATKVDYNGSKRNVIVTSKAKETMSAKEMKNIKIMGSGQSSNKTVKLSKIASFKDDETLSTITRINQKRATNVTAAVDKNYNITKQTDKAKSVVDKIDLPKGVSVEFKGEDEAIMEAMVKLMKMLLLGILMIYLVMVAQFQSLLSPFIVMFTVPLAITGAMIGLIITGFDLSVVSMIGIIMLMGIIVNNAIVLIDYINQLRREGMEKRAAIVQAGAVRLRPVLMTTVTTVLGLLPLALGLGVGSEMMQPVAVVCIGGLLYATLMTLFVIPIMYDLLNRKNLHNISSDELTIATE